MNVDEASNNKGAGIGIVCTTPERPIIKQYFTLGFPASNNRVEYEAVLVRLRMAITLGVAGVEVRCDSSLVVNQVCGDYDARDAQRAEYLQHIFR